jgi:hypothetical protein
MERNPSKGSADAPVASADKTDPPQNRRQRRLLEFLAWRSLGVRSALSRAKRRVHGHKLGPIKSIAVL